MSKWGIGKPGADKPLQDHINWYVGQGYIVQSQTAESAQLVKPKRMSIVWLLAWALLFGVGALIYLFYHFAMKKGGSVYLYVEDGKVNSR